MAKIAIIGGEKGNLCAPWDDVSWEKWVLGNQMDQYDPRKVNRIFEIHEDLSEHDELYPAWLSEFCIPLVVSDKFPKCFLSKVFDYEEASKLIGENFSSSISVMMAQAIMDEAEEIGIWGVHMSLDEHEYFMQRPSMEQWIGYAKGRGIKVHVHESSPLGYTTYREGRDWPDKGFSGFDKGFFKNMELNHIKKCEQIEKEINSLQAVKNRYDNLVAIYQCHDGARQVYKKLCNVNRAKEFGLDVKVDNV